VAEMWSLLVRPENDMSELSRVFRRLGIKGSYSLAYCHEEDFRTLATYLNNKIRRKAFLALAGL
jgi:hypothetical protein